MDIFYPSIFYKIGHKDAGLKLMITSLYGFTSDYIISRGMITLSVALGESAKRL